MSEHRRRRREPPTSADDYRLAHAGGDSSVHAPREPAGKWIAHLSAQGADARGGTLTALQRLAGNNAVQRAVTAGRPTVAQPVVQRDPGPAPAPARATTLEPSDLAFRRLPPGRGFMTGTGLNTRAEELQQRVVTSHQVASEVSDILQFLDWTEFVQGERDVAAVEAAAGDVAARSRGRKGTPLREATEGYTQANPALEAQVENVVAAKARVDAAVAAVNAALTEQKLTGARREEKTAESQVTAHKAQIEKTKKWATKIFDTALDVAFDPTKIKDAVKGLVKFAGSELIVGPLVEGWYGVRTHELTEQLNRAKQRVLLLEDEADMHAVEQAAKSLEAATAAYRAEMNLLLVAVRKAEANYATLVEELEAMGGTGENAAAALDARQAAAAEGAKGLEKVLEYRSMIQNIEKSAHLLRIGYLNYAGMASSPGGKNYVPDDDLRLQLWSIADDNKSRAETVASWAVSQLAQADSARSYLAGGSYMKKYVEIDSVLHEALQYR